MAPDLSRRRFLGTAGTVAAAAACAPFLSSTSAWAAGAGHYPVTVASADGDVEIPARPERVLVGDNGALLADMVVLGVLPVVYGEWFQYGVNPLPWIERANPKVASVPVLTSTDPEAALKYEPDLLLVHVDTPVPPETSSLAPVVVVEHWDDWRKRQQLVAKIFDRAARSKQVMAKAAKQIAATEQRLGARTKYRLEWISAYYSDGTKVLRYTADSPLSRLLVEAGFPPLAEGGEGGYEELSLELAPEKLTGDALVVEDWSATPNQEFGTDDVLSSELVRRSPAYRSGRILRLDVDESIASFVQSALSIPVTLGALERLPRS